VLRFGEAGKAPLVFLHGSASNSAVWLGAVNEFLDRFSVYCVDIPGEPGLSDPIRCRLDSDEPRRWLRSLLDALGIAECSFVTMSLGSWYALNLAIHAPERVRAVSMLTAPGIVPAKKSFLFYAVFCALLGKTGQRLLNRAIYYKAEVPQSLLEYQALVAKHFNPLMEAIPIFGDDELRSMRARIQFFGGDHDALIDSVRTGFRIQSLIPHAEVRILNNTGHAIIDQFSAILDFLAFAG